MAVAFSSHSLSVASSSLSTIRTPAKTLKPPQSVMLTFKTSQNSLCCKSNPGFPRHSRRSFKAAIDIAESDSAVEEGKGDACIDNKKQAADVRQDQRPPMNTLIKVYREALLNGEGKTISDIEAMICNVENEKNELLQKVTELSADITYGKDKLVRLKADFDNFRKRSENDRVTLTSDAKGELMESLLCMVDSFERVKQQIKPGTEKEKKINTSYQGIYKQFVEVLRSMNVSVVETVGKPYSPSVHEAVAREESVVFKEGVIIQEVCRGFVLGDRLLRPAKVKISAGAGSMKAPGISEKSVDQSTTEAGSSE